jgi:hypothetical protein
LNLTREQEKRLKAGDYRPLFFPHHEHKTEPVQPQFRLVLDWEDGYRIADTLGNVTVVPRIPLRWIVVTSVKRDTRAKGWLVRFEATDHRQAPHFMARGGGYTTSRFRAIDDLETIPDKDQQRMADAASKRDHLIRLEAVAAARVERMRFRRTRQHAARRLSEAA